MKRNSINPGPGWQKRVEEDGYRRNITPNGRLLERVGRTTRSRWANRDARTGRRGIQATASTPPHTSLRKTASANSASASRAATASGRHGSRSHPRIYGRFDLRLRRLNPPKLLEYNADTPTSLLEAAVIQWLWFRGAVPEERPRPVELDPRAPRREMAQPQRWMDGTVYFAHVADPTGEDLMTTTYLRDTASEAGLATVGMTCRRSGWDLDRLGFVGSERQPVKSSSSCIRGNGWWTKSSARSCSTVWASLRRGPHAVDRTDLEDAVEQQGPAARPVGAVPGPSESLAASFIEGIVAEPYVKKPKLRARGREHHRRRSLRRSVIEQTDGDYGADGCVYQSMAKRASRESLRRIRRMGHRR